MSFVLIEPTGTFFVNPSYESWDFTDTVENATKYKTIEQAEAVKEIIDRAVSSTYWDWSDIVPYPEIKKV